jgi:nuclear pore complex protein Nup205
MAEIDDLERIHSLHEDLLVVPESRLLNVDRLWGELESRLEEFKKLLEKPSRSDGSRRTLTTGMRSLPPTS